MSILLTVSIGAAKIIHNKSFKDNDRSIAMEIEVVRFHCVNPEIFLQLRKFDPLEFLVI